MQLLCSVIRTHRQGQRLRETDWDAPEFGHVKMCRAHYEPLNRYVEVMRLDADDGSGHGRRNFHVIPDLFEPKMLAFTSARGMMIVGFEEINNQRYYQGWWLQWMPPETHQTERMPSTLL